MALLRIRALRVAYRGLVAVDGADVDILPGEIHGVIGPNGAGKTTFFNAISGLVAIGGGTISLDGTEIGGERAYRRARRGIRRTFQSVQLIQGFTVLENVMTGLHHQAGTRTAWFGRRAEMQRQDSAMAILDYLGIAGIALRRPETLSFAQQRYVELARALVCRPRLLLLDEPAAGLTQAEVVALDALIQRLRAEFSLSVVLIEHILPLVLGVSDRITVFDRGRVIAHGTPAAIQADPAVRAAYLGGGDA